MAFISNLYGKQINKSAQLAAHAGVGALLNFDSYADFPTPDTLCLDKVLCGRIGDEETGIPEYFNYADTSTRNMYVDSSSNIMYRWRHYTVEEWKAAHWDQDEQGNYIAPVLPLLEDFSDEEEYNIALSEYNAALYPLNPDVEDASQGWCYVPCAGGGGGSDLYWSKF